MKWLLTAIAGICFFWFFIVIIAFDVIGKTKEHGLKYALEEIWFGEHDE